MRSDITRVHGAIRPYIRETPVLATSGSDVGLGRFPLTLKLEFLQHSGSFKVRGAFANLLRAEQLDSMPRALDARLAGGGL